MMLVKLKRLSKTELVRTSYYTGIATFLQSLSGVVVTKIIAIFIGPAGVAIISQFQNFINLSTAAATGGLEQGVVKYVAEFKTKPNDIKFVISNAFKLSILFAFVVSFLILLFANSLSEKLFNTDAYRQVILVFGGTIILFSINRIFISILNGTGEIKKLVTVKISNSIFALLVTSLSAYFFGIYGALYALGISQSIIFFISLYFITRCSWFNLTYFSQKISRVLVIKYLKYSLMSITSMILVPVVFIGIRNYLIQNISLEKAGLWDGMNRISNAYLGVITTTLGYYYLPKLASLNEKKLIDKEILNGYKIILPVVIFIMSVMLIFREQIVLLLFSNEFVEMERLFLPQIIGDFFKITSFILSYLMLAKAKTGFFVLTQIGFLSLLYISSISLVDIFGIEGAVYAHALNYFLYFILMIVLYKFKLLT